MPKEPRTSAEERERQTERLYAKVGKIAVHGEHLNYAMFQCTSWVLQMKGLQQKYATAVLASQNLENMRRTWESLMKDYFADDTDAVGMIDHLSTRIDNVIQRRNDTVHRRWLIGWGNEETESYEVASGINARRDIGKKGRGGVKYTSKDTKDFEEIIKEIENLTSLVMRFIASVVDPAFGSNLGKPVKIFHYNSKGNLVGSPPEQKK